MPQSETLQKIISNMETVIVGKRSVIELSLITLLSDGHLLLEDVPGLGKLPWQSRWLSPSNAAFPESNLLLIRFQATLPA